MNVKSVNDAHQQALSVKDPGYSLKIQSILDWDR